MWRDHWAMLHVSQLLAMATLLNMEPFCLMLHLQCTSDLGSRILQLAMTYFSEYHYQLWFKGCGCLRQLEAAGASLTEKSLFTKVYQHVIAHDIHLNIVLSANFNKIDVGKLWITSYADSCVAPHRVDLRHTVWVAICCFVAHNKAKL